MKIEDIHVGDKKIDIHGKVKDMSKVRQVNTRNGPNIVCDMTLSDESGSITVSLWGEDTARFKEGDMVVLSNGYCTSYKGQLQLNIGKFGSIKRV